MTPFMEKIDDIEYGLNVFDLRIKSIDDMKAWWIEDCDDHDLKYWNSTGRSPSFFPLGFNEELQQMVGKLLRARLLLMTEDWDLY